MSDRMRGPATPYHKIREFWDPEEREIRDRIRLVALRRAPTCKAGPEDGPQFEGVVEVDGVPIRFVYDWSDGWVGEDGILFDGDYPPDVGEGVIECIPSSIDMQCAESRPFCQTPIWGHEPDPAAMSRSEWGIAETHDLLR